MATITSVTNIKNGNFINYSVIKGKGIAYSRAMPTVPKMRTRGQCKLSEEELVNRIVKLAQSDAAAGKDSQHGVLQHGRTRGNGRV